MNLNASRLASPHEHVYLGGNHERNERRTWLVIAITAAMMVVEITAGSIFGSMALIADGWHMSTHAGAMLIAALAYRYARRNARNKRFTFGTGKMGDLAGFASAVVRRGQQSAPRRVFFDRFSKASMTIQGSTRASGYP